MLARLLFFFPNGTREVKLTVALGKREKKKYYFGYGEKETQLTLPCPNVTFNKHRL